MRVQPVFPGAAPPAGSVPANRADAATFARLVDRSPTVAASSGSAVAIAASGGLLAVQRTLGRPSASTSALRRADRLLDGLARGQLALLSLADEAAGWQDLERALGEEREPSGSAALDALLDAVELRVAIELAKRERAAEVRREIVSTDSPAQQALA
jgi:hypothetical protein